MSLTGFLGYSFLQLPSNLLIPLAQVYPSSAETCYPWFTAYSTYLGVKSLHGLPHSCMHRRSYLSRYNYPIMEGGHL
jgi:hypothetical protein